MYKIQTHAQGSKHRPLYPNRNPIHEPWYAPVNMRYKFTYLSAVVINEIHTNARMKAFIFSYELFPITRLKSSSRLEYTIRNPIHKPWYAPVNTRCEFNYLSSIVAINHWNVVNPPPPPPCKTRYTCQWDWWRAKRLWMGCTPTTKRDFRSLCFGLLGILCRCVSRFRCILQVGLYGSHKFLIHFKG